jgi:uncharacterized membrane protein
MATRLLRVRRSTVVVAGAAFAWSVLWLWSTFVIHERYGTVDHDLGIWDQAVWLLAHGRSFSTVRGLHVFGFHVSPALFLLAPFYRLGAGVLFLNAVMIGSLSAGSLAVLRLARRRSLGEWQSVVLALAFLVDFSLQGMLHETFHPEVVAIAPLLFAYLAAAEGRWRAFAAWLVAALLWKEDVALAGAMLGLVVLVGSRFPRIGPPMPRGARRAGLLAFAGCALWFVVATRLVIPHYSPAGNFTGDLFGNLGNSPTELARTALTDPTRIGRQLERSNPLRYGFDLLAAYGMTPLLAPVVLLIGLPQAAVNLLGTYDFFWRTKVHYAALPVLALTLASVEGVARWRRPKVRQVALGLVALGAAWTSAVWGLTPLDADTRVVLWERVPVAQRAEFDRFVAFPGPHDGVSTRFDLVTHLSHRERIFTFPNPWLPQNWGVRYEHRLPGSSVDWLMLNPSALNERELGVLTSVVADPDRLLDWSHLPPAPDTPDVTSRIDRTKWDVVESTADVLVLHRIR